MRSQATPVPALAGMTDMNGVRATLDTLLGLAELLGVCRLDERQLIETVNNSILQVRHCSLAKFRWRIPLELSSFSHLTAIGSWSHPRLPTTRPGAASHSTWPPATPLRRQSLRPRRPRLLARRPRPATPHVGAGRRQPLAVPRPLVLQFAQAEPLRPQPAASLVEQTRHRPIPARSPIAPPETQTCRRSPR